MIPWRDGVADIDAILAALTVSADGVALGTRRMTAPRAARESALARLLYEECFIKGIDEREPPHHMGADVQAFVAALSAHNAGKGRISAGWRFEGWGGDGRAIVVKDGRRFRVAAQLVRRSGDAVEIHAPKDDLAASDAFYYAYGDALPLGEALEPRTRFYVNVASDGAAPLVGALTLRLNADHVPFSLKCFRDPHDYYRRDGVVVYADSRRDAHVVSIVVSSAEEMRSFVRDATPILTHGLGPGIACAPEPGRESYGQRCCRILASAILAAGESSAACVVETAERVAAGEADRVR